MTWSIIFRQATALCTTTDYWSVIRRLVILQTRPWRFTRSYQLFEYFLKKKQRRKTGRSGRPMGDNKIRFTGEEESGTEAVSYPLRSPRASEARAWACFMSRGGRHPHAAVVSAVAEGKRTGAAAEWRSGATQVWMNAWGLSMNGCVALCTWCSWPLMPGCHSCCSRKDRLYTLWSVNELFGSYNDLLCRLETTGSLRGHKCTPILSTIMRIWNAWLMRIF